MEHDVILPYEMHQFGILILPEFLPVWRKLLGGRYVADRGIEPHVEDLSLGIR